MATNRQWLINGNPRPSPGEETHLPVHCGVSEIALY